MSTDAQVDIRSLCKIWRKKPLAMQKKLWPNIVFYDKQKQMIHSVRDNKETIVVAGNMLGKDFVAGFIVLWYFLTHDFVRIVTTSVKDDHLDILWDEINKYIRTCELPLDAKEGGPLSIKHRQIRKVFGSKEGIEHSYVKGQVSQKGEGMSGHHARHTLLVVDEASGVEDVVYEHGIEWAFKRLIFGNPNPCTNFFYKKSKAGDQVVKNKTIRRVIRIKGEDSPNVRYGLAEERSGKEPSYKRLVPGVLGYEEYLERRATWDPILQCIKLDAEFYEGAEVKLCPPEWLNAAETYAKTLPANRKGMSMGVDTGEGGDPTAWCIGDTQGIIHIESFKTPDTSIIPGKTLALADQFGVPYDRIMFDQGGGGQEHADTLRAKGYKVQYVSFGESVAPEPVRHLVPWEDKQHDKREKFAYKNRRAQMYGLIRLRLAPKEENSVQFGIPDKYTELRRQLSVLPLSYDEEGRMYLPPKNKKPNANTVSLFDLIGRSPDEADALALMVYGLEPKSNKRILKSMV